MIYSATFKLISRLLSGIRRNFTQQNNNMDYLIFFATSFAVFMAILILIKLNKSSGEGNKALMDKLDDAEKNQQALEQRLREEFRQNRTELGANLNAFQQQFLDTLKEISRMQQDQLNGISKTNQEVISAMSKTLEEKLGQLTERVQLNADKSRVALDASLKSFQDSFSQNVREFNELQKQKFAEMERKQGELITSTELKLEKMRETVDEKLQKTLETRLGQSFELVSKQLESVQKGLGEMQTLANDVGGLKRVLSNVKTRGVLGEIQLGNILEQIMAPEQYDKNVKTKRSSNDIVEFAIKLPGRDDQDGAVYLPLDAKFPQEAYHLLQIAYDEGNALKVDEATKTLANSISKFAKDISEKYLDPPFTTDFAIMFLPIEGLYAEVVRNTDLIEQLQRKYKVIVTGPTTLAAILNSLQMGFRTLAIQKRSSEVWRILGEVKTEFGKFGDVLKKAQDKIRDASTEIDKLVTTRTNVMQRKLKEVQELPATDPDLLAETNLFEDDES